VHTHQLLVEDIFTFAENLFGLTATRFLSLTLSPFALSKLDHRGNATLLLQAHKLFGEVVHRLGNDRRLESLSDSVNNSLLVVVDQISLFRKVR